MNGIMFLKKVKRHICWRLKLDKLYDRMTDQEYIKFLYKKSFGKELDFENPITFSEKIQWLKIYNRRPEYTDMVDKFTAKKYIESLIGNEYIIPTLGVWDSFDEIDFNELPNQFVLKCTHNSGGLIICKDKSKFNMKTSKKKIDNSLKRNYYLSSREWPYKNVIPKIIAEEYIENNIDGLHDYKIWCFNGEPIYIQFITGRVGNCVYEGFYDTKWNLQEFTYHNPKIINTVKKPECLDTLLELARVIAQSQPFVRCDFYVLEDGSIRFGEITFYPMSGLEHWKPYDMDKVLGDMIDLTYGS